MATDNFINEYQLKVLIIEDKFSDIKDVFLNLLQCENIYDIKRNEMRSDKKNEFDYDIFKNSTRVPGDKISSGVFVFNPADENNKITDIKDIGTFFEKVKAQWQFDLFLIDLKLGTKKSLSGRKILNEFKKSYPDVPVFVFTWTFSKDEIIEDIKKYESDGYFHKSEIKDLDEIISKHYDENFGQPWLLIRQKDIGLSYHLRKCLLTWRRNPKLLWHGEKAMHLVDHTFKHSRAMYNLLDKFVRLFKDKEDELLKIFAGTSKENNENCKKETAIKNLFYLSMAIWVHDIGMKGYKDFFWCYEIRKKHPIISGYLIDKYADKYLLLRDIDFENKKNIEIEYVKNIALLSTFHLFAAPLTEKMLEIDRIKEKAREDFVYPTKYDFLKKYAKNKNLKRGDILTLESLNKSLLIPAALLRFFDVLDKGVHRVGIYEEEDIKLNVCFEDARALKLELDEELRKLTEQMGFVKYLKSIESDYKNLISFSNNLENEINELQKYYTDLLAKIRGCRAEDDWETPYLKSYNYFTDIRRQKDDLCRNLKKLLSPTAIDRCIMLFDQIFFYLETPLHFITHRTFADETDLNFDGNKIDINFYFNEDFISFGKDITFANLNRLFQESWKVFADILREYQPLESVFSIKFGKIRFHLKSSEGEVLIFLFDLNGKYLEKQFIIYFDVEKEKDAFLNEFFHKILKKKKPDPTKNEIVDKFWDFKIGENPKWGLKERKWFFRERKINNKIEWSIKIEPLYWKGEYETKIEVGPVDNNEIGNFVNESSKAAKAFKKLLEKEPFNKNALSIINLNNLQFENFLGENKCLSQTRNKYEVSYNNIPIDVFEGDIGLDEDGVDIVGGETEPKKKGKRYFFLEIEAKKDSKPWEQEKIIEELIEKIRALFPEIKIESKNKLDWLLEVLK